MVLTKYLLSRKLAPLPAYNRLMCVSSGFTKGAVRVFKQTGQNKAC